MRGAVGIYKPSEQDKIWVESADKRDREQKRQEATQRAAVWKIMEDHQREDMKIRDNQKRGVKRWRLTAYASWGVLLLLLWLLL
jgi:hypothetical protein